MKYLLYFCSRKGNYKKAKVQILSEEYDKI